MQVFDRVFRVVRAPRGLARTEVAERPLSRVFRDGIVVNLLNPKSALFLVAFLPQFVDPAKEDPQRRLLLLGLGFVGRGALTDASWATTAGTLGAFR